jgi:small ligand-binding sensory domain FIST
VPENAPAEQGTVLSGLPLTRIWTCTASTAHDPLTARLLPLVVWSLEGVVMVGIAGGVASRVQRTVGEAALRFPAASTE